MYKCTVIIINYKISKCQDELSFVVSRHVNLAKVFIYNKF